MIVYFADRFLNILGKASTGLPKGYRIINDVKTEDVDSGVSTFEFDLKYKEDTLSEARNMVYPGNYVMRSYDDLDEFYTIIDTEADTSNNTIYVYALIRHTRYPTMSKNTQKTVDSKYTLTKSRTLLARFLGTRTPPHLSGC